MGDRSVELETASLLLAGGSLAEQSDDFGVPEVSPTTLNAAQENAAVGSPSFEFKECLGERPLIVVVPLGHSFQTSQEGPVRHSRI